MYICVKCSKELWDIVKRFSIHITEGNDRGERKEKKQYLKIKLSILIEENNSPK